MRSRRPRPSTTASSPDVNSSRPRWPAAATPSCLMVTSSSQVRDSLSWCVVCVVSSYSSSMLCRALHSAVPRGGRAHETRIGRLDAQPRQLHRPVPRRHQGARPYHDPHHHLHVALRPLHRERRSRRLRRRGLRRQRRRPRRRVAPPTRWRAVEPLVGEPRAGPQGQVLVVQDRGIAGQPPHPPQGQGQGGSYGPAPRLPLRRRRADYYGAQQHPLYDVADAGLLPAFAVPSGTALSEPEPLFPLFNAGLAPAAARSSSSATSAGDFEKTWGRDYSPFSTYAFDQRPAAQQPQQDLVNVFHSDDEGDGNDLPPLEHLNP